MEAPACGVSSPSFRQLVKETGTAFDPEQEECAFGPCHLCLAGEWPGSPPHEEEARDLSAVCPAPGSAGTAALTSPPAPQSCPPATATPCLQNASLYHAACCLEPSWAPQHPHDQAIALLVETLQPGPRLGRPLCHDSAQAHLIWGPPPSRVPPPGSTPAPDQAPRILWDPSAEEDARRSPRPAPQTKTLSRLASYVRRGGSLVCRRSAPAPSP